MVKTLSPAVKYGQNFVSGGKNGLIILKNVAEGALPEKMHQGPPESKAAPAPHPVKIFFGGWILQLSDIISRVKDTTDFDIYSIHRSAFARFHSVVLVCLPVEVDTILSDDTNILSPFESKIFCGD